LDYCRLYSRFAKKVDRKTENGLYLKMFRQMLIMAGVLIKKRPVNHQYNIAGLLEHDGATFAVVNRGGSN